MTKCSVKNCPNDSRSSLKKDGVSYFSYPRDPIRCSKWAAIIEKGRGEKFYKPRKGSVVCSDHFLQSDIYTTAKGFSRLVKSAKPTLRLRDNNGSIGNNIIQEPDEDSIYILPHADEELCLYGESSSQQDDDLEKLQRSPSTSLSIGSILDTPKEEVLKKKLNMYEKMIKNKNRQINRLQKQNKRVIKKNISLKKELSVFKKKSALTYRCLNLSQNVKVTENFNINERKIPFAKYPPGEKW